ncbi:SGNH/GDSL hydrolase family protein [Paenibacillus sp. y28]|uniref:SGNH/GDSL hydrolase family protein n=1 Tax=Paenibacillus sp. y28 TaxID=3129110 RepID=UPI003018EA1F
MLIFIVDLQSKHKSSHNWWVYVCAFFIRPIGAYQHTIRELAAQYDAVFVPLQAAFNQACERAEAVYWIWDGVHPTAAGHDLIAREWPAAVQGSRLTLV